MIKLNGIGSTFLKLILQEIKVNRQLRLDQQRDLRELIELVVSLKSNNPMNNESMEACVGLIKRVAPLGSAVGGNIEKLLENAVSVVPNKLDKMKKDLQDDHQDIVDVSGAEEK